MNTVTNFDEQQINSSQLSSVKLLSASLTEKANDINYSYNILRDTVNQLFYVLQLSKTLLVTINNQIMACPTNNQTVLTLSSAYNNLQESKEKVADLQKKLSII